MARGVLIVVIGRAQLAGLTTLPRQDWRQNALVCAAAGHRGAELAPVAAAGVGTAPRLQPGEAKTGTPGTGGRQACPQGSSVDPGMKHVWNRRRCHAYAGQPAPVRRAAAAAAPRPGRGRHRHQRRPGVPHVQGRRATCATCSARATCATCTGNAGIGHCRYPTAGRRSSELESQPFYVNSPFGITLAHNGNLTNSEALKRELFQLDFRHVNTNSDSEVLLNVLALELERAAHHATARRQRDLHARSPAVHKRCRGAYAIVAMIAGYGLLAFRDPLRHPAADHRRQRGRWAAPSTSSPASRSRIEPLGFRRAARRRAGRGDLHRPDRRASTARQCADEPAPLPVHLRVRLSCASRLA